MSKTTQQKQPKRLRLSVDLAIVEPQTVNIDQDRKVVLRLPTGENLTVDFANGRERWLTVYPSLAKTKVEIYGKMPHLRTSLGQKIENYQMTPLTEEDFA